MRGCMLHHVIHFIHASRSCLPGVASDQILFVFVRPQQRHTRAHDRQHHQRHVAVEGSGPFHHSTALLIHHIDTSRLTLVLVLGMGEQLLVRSLLLSQLLLWVTNK